MFDKKIQPSGDFKDGRGFITFYNVHVSEIVAWTIGNIGQ